MRFLKSGALSALFLIAAMCGMRERAQASVFCPADVALVVPWDIAGDEPAQSDASSHYLFELHGDAPGLFRGHMMLVTDAKAYSVAFDNVQLVRSLNKPNEFYSDAAFLALPGKEAIRYAWIDDVTDAQGKASDCPTFPFKVLSMTAADRAEISPANVRPAKGPYVFNGLRAQFKMDLPPLNCAKPYSDAGELADIAQTYDFYDPSIVRSPVVEGRVDIDSNGNPVAVEIVKPSGAVAFDAYVREWYGAHKYRPAIFRCTAVVASYYFKVEYSRR